MLNNNCHSGLDPESRGDAENLVSIKELSGSRFNSWMTRQMLIRETVYRFFKNSNISIKPINFLMKF